MRWLSVLQVSVVAGVAAATFALVSSPPVEGQARTAGIPRLNGKPDLNGIWQAVNTANWDIQAHTAKPALAMRPGPGRAGPGEGSARVRRGRFGARRRRASSKATSCPTPPRA